MFSRLDITVIQPLFAIEPLDLLWIGGGGVFLFLVLLAAYVFGRRRKPKVKRAGRQLERLAEYPPPPPVGEHQLWVYNEPVRVRLVVIAPAGKRSIETDDPEKMLDHVVRGLSGIIAQDKARILTWPAQLSVQGFSPTFGRAIELPDEPETPTQWQLISGPMKFGKEFLLVGMAMLAEQAYERKPLTPQPHQWMEWLRVLPTQR